MFRRGKIKEAAGGIGGGFVASILLNRVMAGRAHAGTVETVGGIGAAYLVGGVWGAAAYVLLRLATTGFTVNGQPIGFAQTTQGGGAPALGVRVLGQ